MCLPARRDQGEFSILGEDRAFLAVDKPAGMLVHPTRPGGPRTLWDGLRELLGYELATGGQVSIVNRLDRETSGVVVVAKTSEAAREAGLAMAARAAEKRYLAVVFGWPEWDTLLVEAAMLRSGEVGPSGVYLEQKVDPRGARAVTALRVLGRGEVRPGRVALIEARPETGRTHQIRVHLAHAGFPVLGDKLYARGSHHYLDFVQHGWNERLHAALWHPRQALHCAGMKLCGREWAAPDPPDLAPLFGLCL
jgi:23S rRNA pseudouridine1911/1915/1917 synthase